MPVQGGQFSPEYPPIIQIQFFYKEGGNIWQNVTLRYKYFYIKEAKNSFPVMRVSLVRNIHDVPTRIQDTKTSQLEALLPHNWKPQTKN